MKGTVKETIKVDYKFGKAVGIESLNALQGELKTLSEGSYNKLKTEILRTGFAFAPHVWKDKNAKLWLVDGHQRIATLKRMKSEGAIIPKIPVVEVAAASLKEAKVRVLQGISQYGDMNLDFLDEFLPTDLKLKEVDMRFEIPSFKFTEETEKKEDPIEINRAEVESTLVHTCPKCGHQFGKQKE